MLDSDSEGDSTFLKEKSAGFILRNEKPNLTNLLEIEQSKIYHQTKNNFKSPSSKLENKSSLNKASINKSSVNKFDRTEDLSSFDCEIPSELYSLVEGRKVFRLFNHIEHVKDDDSLSTTSQLPSNSLLKSTRFQNYLIDKDNFVKEVNLQNDLSKENFRVNTLPDESKFCNFLSQTKFDTLIEDDQFDLTDDEFKTLTETNDKINNCSKYSFLKNQLNKLNVANLNEINNNLNEKLSNDLVKKTTTRELDKNDSKYFSSCKSINDTKENQHSKSLLRSNKTRFEAKDNSINQHANNKLVRNSIHLNINLIRNQSSSIRSTAIKQQNSKHDSITLTNLNEQSLDVFRDFSDNMAKLNETKPSYLKSMNESNKDNTKSMSPNLDDELSMNFSPIKPANGIKDNFFKTPFKKPSLPRSTNLVNRIQNRIAKDDHQPEEQINKDEFLCKEKLQSTFVDNNNERSSNSNSRRRSKLNEDEIRQNIENELQKLKFRNEQLASNKELSKESNLTRKMEQTKLNDSDNQSTRLSNRTTDLLEKTRSKIEEFKRQQLEKSKSSDKVATFDSTSLNIGGRNSCSKLNDYQLSSIQNSLSNQLNTINGQTKGTYSKYDSRLIDNNKPTTVDQSELDNDKFRLIEEQLKQAEFSITRNSLTKSATKNSICNRYLSSQSLQNLKVQDSHKEVTKDRSTKSASLISHTNLSDLDDSNDRTLIGDLENNLAATTNQTYSKQYLNLEDQKTYLKFLNTQLNKIKDLEDKSKLIKRRTNDKKKIELNSKITTATTIATKKPNSTETSNSLKTLSLNTISPSSIDLSDQNLDSILQSPSDNSVELSFHSVEEKELNRIQSDKLKSKINKKCEEIDSSFHCKCCRRNQLNLINKQNELPVNSLNKFDDLNNKETELYNQFSKQMDRIQSNQLLNQQKFNLPQINRKQTFNKIDLLVDRQLNDTFQKQQSNEDRNITRDEERNLTRDEKEENNLSLNNQSLDEVFKNRRPRVFNNIQYRRSLIQKKMQNRKELELIKKSEEDKLAFKNKQKNLNRTNQLISNLMNSESPNKVNQARMMHNHDLFKKRFN